MMQITKISIYCELNFHYGLLLIISECLLFRERINTSKVD